MLRSALIACLAMLPVMALAQPAPSSESDQATSTLVGPPKPTEEKGPIAAVTFGYIYIDSEVMPGQVWNSHLHGFFGIPQYNAKPWFSLFADFTQTYNTSRNAHENVQSRLGGMLFTLHAKQKISPFAFVDGGVARDSKAGLITTSPILATGGGFTYKINKHLALLIIPGEYIRTYAATGPLNNFTTRFGFVLPLYR